MGKVCRNLRYVEENLWQISLLRKEAYIALLIALLVAAFTDTAVLLLLSLEASSTSTIIIDDSDFPGDEFPRNEEIECIPVFLLPFLTAHSTHSDYPNGKITSFRQSNLIDYEILTSLAVPRRHRHQTGSITWDLLWYDRRKREGLPPVPLAIQYKHELCMSRLGWVQRIGKTDRHISAQVVPVLEPRAFLTRSSSRVLSQDIINKARSSI